MAETSALHSIHEELGARFVDFGGWEMPVQYTSVLAEHRAVRESVGVFDVSHLGRFEISGDDPANALDSRFCNLASGLGRDRTQYTMALNDAGGVIDDIILWRWSDGGFWVLPNAANSPRIMETVMEADGVTSVQDLRPTTVSLAVQGPDAPALLERLFGAAPKRSRLIQTDFQGAPLWVAGTGYTGERGGELVMNHDIAPTVFRELLAHDVVPCGLASRDTLRLEAALPLWGQDLDETITPLQAGLGFAVSYDHEFPGKAALEREREEGVARHRVLFSTEGRLIPRHGFAVRAGGRTGTVTSGNFSPTLEHGIGMAYLSGPPDDGLTELEVEIRGTWHAAEIVPKFLI
jgi:aminomethyltransferase